MRSSVFPWGTGDEKLLTDIAGVRVGHADDAALASGVAAVMFDKPAVAAIEPAQDGRIYIELVNGAFLKAGGTPRLMSPSSSGVF